MKLIIDANIVISAVLNPEGKTRELIFLEDLELVAPDFLISELEKHKHDLIVKSKVSKEEFDLIISIILSKISLIPFAEFGNFLNRAKSICIDPNDEEYFALALALNCPIWSNDKDLKNQKVIKIISTTELIEMIEKFENKNDKKTRNSFFRRKR